MILVDAAREQQLVWLLVGLAAAAAAFRLARPAERRSLRLSWALVACASGAVGVGLLAGDSSPLGQAALGAGVALGGFAALQVAGVLVFRGVLFPRFGAPHIAQDLAVTVCSIAWGLLWLRLSGVDPAQLFTTSAVFTAVVAFSMQDTLGNVLGGVALQLDNSLVSFVLFGVVRAGRAYADNSLSASKPAA